MVTDMESIYMEVEPQWGNDCMAEIVWNSHGGFIGFLIIWATLKFFSSLKGEIKGEDSQADSGSLEPFTTILRPVLQCKGPSITQALELLGHLDSAGGGDGPLR